MELPGKTGRYPLGVYDHEPDEDVPGLRAVDVGDSFPAKWAQKLTEGADAVSDFLSNLSPLP